MADHPWCPMVPSDIRNTVSGIFGAKTAIAAKKFKRAGSVSRVRLLRVGVAAAVAVADALCAGSQAKFPPKSRISRRRERFGLVGDVQTDLAHAIGRVVCGGHRGFTCA